MHHTHNLGYVIRRLREMHAAGATPVELRSYLQQRLPGDDAYRAQDYLTRAFLQGMTAMMSLLPPGPLTEAQERSIARRFDERKSQWISERFPELMRVRDYFSFLRVAQEEGIIIIVCGANPFAGGLIGSPGYRCYDGRSFVVSRETSPNKGVIAADPHDPRLLDALERFSPSLSYDEYVERLIQQGYRVGTAESGYAVQDANGLHVHEGYRLHGVYDASSGDPVWTAKRGESLRRDINLQLGAELVRSGPHDDWEHRNNMEVAGPLCGPQLPAIAFAPEHEMDELLTINDLARDLRYRRHWDRLYPNHPVTR